MPSSKPVLPPEILALIFDLVRNDGSRRLSHIDLLCCSLVSRDWYASALPFILRPLTGGGDLEVDRYDNDHLCRLTDIFRDSKRTGLDLGCNGQRIMIEYGNLVCFENSWDAHHGITPNGQPPRAMLDSTRAQVVNQLICALGSRMSTLDLNMHNSMNPARLKIFHDMHTALTPGFRHITTLRITLLSLGERAPDTPPPPTPPKSNNRISTILRACTPYKIDESSSLSSSYSSFSSSSSSITNPSDHPIISLIHHLSPTLESFHLSVSDFTTALSMALRSCLRIHSIWLHNIRFELPPAHLARTIASWPKLHTLSIRNQYNRLPLTPTVASLAQCPPPLSVLELHDYVYDDPNPTLAQLITACATTLTYLALPRLKTAPYDADRLMTDLAKLHLPRLRTLDLNGTAGSFSGRPFQRDGPSPPPSPFLWPELREIKLDECWSGPFACVAHDFLDLVIRSCPLLDRVSLPARSGHSEAVRVLERNKFVVKQWERCWLYVRGDAVKEKMLEGGEVDNGIVVNM